jgi:microcystin-dependent protein
LGTPYLGELKLISWNFAPKSWAFANGQLLPINQNQALFSLYGTTFGGDGRTNFAIPDLRGKVPLHPGAGFIQGERGGETAHTLSVLEMPMHIHYGVADSTVAPDPDGRSPAPNKRLARTQPGDLYGPAASLIHMNPNAIGNTGGSQAHDNMQPYLTLNWVVALQGVFPSPN